MCAYWGFNPAVVIHFDMCTERLLKYIHFDKYHTKGNLKISNVRQYHYIKGNCRTLLMILRIVRDSMAGINQPLSNHMSFETNRKYYLAQIEGLPVSVIKPVNHDLIKTTYIL